jgi:tyrosyl-tRNA synthetase
MTSVHQHIALLKRGVVGLITEEEFLQKIQKSSQEKRSLRIKYGADPSAPDIHLGHTVPLRKLRQFQELGHQVVFIIGDFTATIGDPSGQSKTRPTLSHEQVLKNAKTYQDQVFKILVREQTEIRFNSEWFSKMKFSDIIQLASQYSVAQMLERDDFSKRYKEGKPITVLEFLYPLIQGYDSVMIKSDVEIGGTDQTFNLLVGRDLQRSWGQEPQVVMTLPLLEGLDGTMKMSKSLGNYVGVTESPRDIFGKIMSIPDELIFRYFELLTDMDSEEILQLKENISKNNLNPMEAKKDLAEKIVSQLHDSDVAKFERTEFERIFSKKELPENIDTLYCDLAKFSKPVWVVKLLQELELVVSSSEGRRAVRQGAVTIDGSKISSEDEQVVLKEGMIVKVGKRKIKKILFKKA